MTRRFAPLGRFAGLVVALALIVPMGAIQAGPAADAIAALGARVATLESRVAALEAKPAPSPSAAPSRSPSPSAAPTAAPSPSAAPSSAPSATPAPTPLPSSAPSASPAGQTYDATYIARGGDETAALKAFVEGNRGKRLALIGQFGVTSTRWTLPAGAKTTVDFLNGASLREIADGASATLYLDRAFDLELNDPAIVGRGYGTYHPTMQWQHGVGVYGGGRITINRLVTDSTFGDGIDIDVNSTEATPVAVVLNQPKITRACRNGITGNAGEVTVNGGSIDQTGLHGIDLEPNGDREALSIDFRVNGTRLTRASNMPVFDVPGQIIRGRAFSGLGYSAATKKRIDIQNVSSDDFQIAVDHSAVFVFTGNRSDSVVAAPAKTAFYYAIGTKTISGNSGITLVEYAFR